MILSSLTRSLSRTASLIQIRRLTTPSTMSTSNTIDRQTGPASQTQDREEPARMEKVTQPLKTTLSGTKDASKKKERLLLKTPKGTRDYGPGEMFCREFIERIVKDCFSSYGGSCLDTPVFERKDILTGKYGEDAKLIYDLMDQGGEQLALRYDHTVPLARYLAMTGSSNTASKLWQVGKVYRRDNPVMSKGRMREFTQADFDMVGSWDTMIPEAEIISLLCTILTRLEVGDFTIKISNRKILDGIFEICGVPEDKIRSISSAVDKLDKLPWAEVKAEMTEEKGLDSNIADTIGEYVQHKGNSELLLRLEQDSKLTSNSHASEGLKEMSILFDLLRAYGVLDKISFDLSLARGLDYYTGVVYEAVVAASAPPGFGANALETPAPMASVKPKKHKKKIEDDGEEVDESQVGVGSIGAGGRYDNLVGMFLAAAAGDNKKKPQSVPCIGVSIGMDRIFALLWQKWAQRGMRAKETMVYVMSARDGLLQERIQLVQELRQAGIKADYLAKAKPKIQAQFDAGERDEVPFAIIIGSDELKAGIVTVKEQRWQFVEGIKQKVENSDRGVPIKREELVGWLKAQPVLQDWPSGKLIA